MKQILYTILLVALSGMGDLVYANTSHRCAADAIERAPKLLELHFGVDDRMSIDEEVKVVAPIKNPANKEQQFDVLELWGHIYKGRYRMHFIYAQIEGDCVLMGQEILEFADL